MGTRIIIDDLRVSGIGTCPRAREWFERNGINWKDFKGEGLDADRVRDIKEGSSYIARVIKAAEEREARNGS